LAGDAGELAANYQDAVKGVLTLSRPIRTRCTMDDVKSFLEDADLAKTCAVHKTTNAGHRRSEEREYRATDAIDWLKERASRLTKLARHRRHHGKAHRQENGANIRRNALLYNILAGGSRRDPCRHACAVLAAGYTLRRGSLPDK
jgi:hypothetical protein